MDANLKYIARLGPSGPESKRGRRKLDAKIRANYTYNPLCLTSIQRRRMTDANLVLVAAMSYIGFCLRIIAGGISCQLSAEALVKEAGQRRPKQMRFARSQTYVGICKSARMTPGVLEIRGDIYDTRNC